MLLAGVADLIDSEERLLPALEELLLGGGVVALIDSEDLLSDDAPEELLLVEGVVDLIDSEDLLLLLPFARGVTVPEDDPLLPEALFPAGSYVLRVSGLGVAEVVLLVEELFTRLAGSVRSLRITFSLLRLS